MDVEDAWAAFAVGAMLCLGLSDLLNKRAMRAGVRRTQFLVVQSVFFTITTLVLLPFVGGVEWSPQLLYAVACGVITFFSYVFVLKSLETGEATVAVPIYRMSFGVTVVLAVLMLGEDLTARRVLGFCLIVVALITLTAVDGSRRRQAYHSHEGLPVGGDGTAERSLALAAAFALMAMVTIGTKGFLYKVGVSEGAPPTTFALVQSLAFLPMAVGYSLATDRALRVDRMTWSHAPFNGVLTALASVLLLLALVGGDASTAVPISQLCFVVTAVLAVAVFRERMTPLKAVGIASAVVAVVTLSTTLSIL
jgi:transporter family protein